MLIRSCFFNSLLIGFMLSASMVTAEDKGAAAPAIPLPKPALNIPPPTPQAARPPQPVAELPILEKTGPGLYRMGNLTISKASASVSLPAVLNMSKGMLEYLLVRKGGKTHESLFRTDIDPAELQIALLLIGLEGTDRPLARQGDVDTPRGNPVEIIVSYFRDKKMVNLRPEEFIFKKTDGKLTNIQDMEWVFTGSVVHNNKFLAKVEGSIIALYHDPVALIDNASPGGENDRIWFVKDDAVPPVGTPVTITIQAKK